MKNDDYLPDYIENNISDEQCDDEFISSKDLLHELILITNKNDKPDSIKPRLIFFLDDYDEIYKSKIIAYYENIGKEIDEYYDQAARIVTESRNAKVSNLQRCLRIGFNRAAHLIKALEQAEIVGSLQPDGEREVLPLLTADRPNGQGE